jgi:hypothetical protein
MNNIVKYCLNQKSCGKVSYSKVVTSVNNPKLTRAIRYSQYVQTVKPSIHGLIKKDYIKDATIYIELFAIQRNINITASNYIQQTIDFINGNHTTSYQYFEFLKSIFSKNLPALLDGLYPVLPYEKAAYLKRYADIIIPYGDIVPHFRDYSFIYQR